MIHSISILVATSSLIAPTTPQSALKGAMDHYKTLKSFSMTIQHKDSSGLFPGAYTQTLKWRKGDAFELVVTKKSGVKQVPGQPGSAAPNYYCSDGATVTAVSQDRPRVESGLAHDVNTMPGWEVAGGVILSELLGSPSFGLIFSPPPGMSAHWNWGKAAKWQGEQVKEIVVGWQTQGRSEDISFYVSPNGKRVVGFSFKDGGGGKPGWAHYMNQVENPAMPKGLGAAPK
jgi:hypothetical protein